MDYIKQLEQQNEELKQSLAQAQSQSVYWDFEKTVYENENNKNTFHIVARYMITSKHVLAYVSYHNTPYPYQAILCYRLITYDAKTLEEAQEWIVDRYNDLFLNSVDEQLT